jgi:rare lipoprotein A
MMELAACFLLWCVTCNAAEQASWYGEEHRGRPMSNGKQFNPDKLTAASWFYPLGTRVVVTHAGRSVVVEITDRGPARRLVNEGRKIDLSHAAFARLANPDCGLIVINVKKP